LTNYSITSERHFIADVIEIKSEISAIRYRRVTEKWSVTAPWHTALCLCVVR